MFEYIGRKILQAITSLGQITSLFLATLKWMFRKPFDTKNIVGQMVHIGYNSLPVIFITSLFTGMVMALQTGLTLEATLKGMSQFIGSVVSVSMTRELAPVLTALIMAGRIGSSIAAEIGTMQVTEQIDALKTLGTNPVHYLAVPRFLALLFMTPALVMFADFIGWLGGAIVSVLELETPFLTYYYNSKSALKMGDILSGLIKSGCFGMIIATVGCYKGFATSGGAEGVGKSTISSVVTSSIFILVADYFLTSFLNFTLHI
ncbi:MAG: ABC transporter permease [Spirochaetes bacterium]|nr:ABC transporter permease [Spirochaetota bacterium]